MNQGVVYLKTMKVYKDTIITTHDRVICCDDFEIMYESKFVDEPLWPLDKKRISTEIFSRIDRSFYEQSNIELIDYIPYSESKLSILRPDLPLRIGRFRDIAWGDSIFDTIESIESYLSDKMNNLSVKCLLTNRVYLEGTSKREMPGKLILFEAKNNSFFTMAELLYNANITMMSIKSNKNFKSNGIGIYRIGIKSGLPSYYVWGFYDLAGTMEDYEKKRFDITHV